MVQSPFIYDIRPQETARIVFPMHNKFLLLQLLRVYSFNPGTRTRRIHSTHSRAVVCPFSKYIYCRNWKIKTAQVAPCSGGEKEYITPKSNALCRRMVHLQQLLLPLLLQGARRIA